MYSQEIAKKVQKGPVDPFLNFLTPRLVTSTSRQRSFTYFMSRVIFQWLDRQVTSHYLT